MEQRWMAVAVMTVIAITLLGAVVASQLSFTPVSQEVAAVCTAASFPQTENANGSFICVPISQEVAVTCSVNSFATGENANGSFMCAPVDQEVMASCTSTSFPQTESANGEFVCVPVAQEVAASCTSNSFATGENSSGAFECAPVSQEVPATCTANSFATSEDSTGAFKCAPVSWTGLTNFPSNCAAGSVVYGVGVTLSCTATGNPEVSATCTSNSYAVGESSSGAFTCSVVQWSQLGNFPSNCAAGSVVYGVGVTLSCTATGNPEVSATCTGNSFAVNESSSGAFTCAVVQWSQLGNFPSNCAAGSVVYGVGVTLSCTATGNPEVSATCTSNSYAIGENSAGAFTCAVVQWNQLSNFPSNCAAGSVVYGVGTTLSCTATGNPEVSATCTGNSFAVNESSSGAFVCAIVQWNQLGNFPSNCAAGSVVYGVGVTLSCTATGNPEVSASCTSNSYAVGENANGVFTCSVVGWNQLNNWPNPCATNSFVTGVTTTLQCSQVAWTGISGWPNACAANSFVTSVTTTLQCSQVAWTGLSGYPSNCASGSVVYGITTTLSCTAQPIISSQCASGSVVFGITTTSLSCTTQIGQIAVYKGFWPLNEGYKSTTYDLSQNNNYGTLSGSVYYNWDNGTSGWSLGCSGSGSITTTPDPNYGNHAVGVVTFLNGCITYTNGGYPVGTSFSVATTNPTTSGAFTAIQYDGSGSGYTITQTGPTVYDGLKWYIDTLTVTASTSTDYLELHYLNNPDYFSFIMKNSPMWVEGSGCSVLQNNCLQFSASPLVTDTLQGVGVLPTGANPRTMYAWVYLTQAPPSNGCTGEFAFGYGGTAFNTVSALGVTNSGSEITFGSGGNDATAANLPVKTGVWTFIAMTYDGNTGVTLTNGTNFETHTLSQTLATGTTNGNIGGTTGGGCAFTGWIRDVGVLNATLTNQQLNSLYLSYYG